MASGTLDSTPPDLKIIATNEKVTGPPAAEMLHRTLDQTTGVLEVVDIACGGGVVTAELLKYASASKQRLNINRIVAADIDPRMINYVKVRRDGAGWHNVEVKKFDQMSMDLLDKTFTHVFNAFGILFCADDGAALAETHRVLKTGGLAGFTSWKKITWWPTLALPAISTYIPEATPLPEPDTVFPARGWSNPLDIPAKLEQAGFQDIQVSEYSFTPNVEAEEFAEACAVLTKIITKRFWSEEENQKYGDRIEPSFLRYLHKNFPNGKWNEEMVAIISTGKKG